MIGHDAAEVVTSIGGWVFDRAMSGWDVCVHLADTDDARPLRILGARMLDTGLPTGPRGDSVEEADVVAVSRALYDNTTAASDVAQAVMRRPPAAVIVWDHRRDGTMPDAPCHTVRISAAAAVFKAHAMAAAGIARPAADGASAVEHLEILAGRWSSTAGLTVGAMVTDLGASVSMSRAPKDRYASFEGTSRR